MITITFSECEHRGDLSNYIDDLKLAGAEIIDSNVNPDLEEGTVTIKVGKNREFLDKFKKTGSYEFSNIYD